MTKEFLDVLYEELVVQKNIRVILTTHSPSTIALTNESHIFCMSKSGQRFTKASKDKTLGLLTAGLNTISIEYENRRQVIVESNYDRKFYEMVYTKIKPHLLEDISLYFISSGIDKIPVSEEVPDGDCGRVKNIVKELTNGGNTKVFGIIDWDGKNNATPNIFVSGHRKRYSVENFILDPILIAAILLDYQLVSREDLELTENENFSDFENLSAAKLNFISEFISKKVEEKLDTPPTVTTNKSIEYLNGQTIQVPTWYLEHQGHKLEKLVIEAFPKLKSEFGAKTRLPDIPDGISVEEKEQRKKESKILFENQLVNIIKNKIVQKTIDSIPGFVPLELKNLFLEIQK